MIDIEMYFVQNILPLIAKYKHNHIVVDSNNNEYYYSLNIDYDNQDEEKEENIVGLFIGNRAVFFDDKLKSEETYFIHYCSINILFEK